MGRRERAVAATVAAELRPPSGDDRQRAVGPCAGCGGGHRQRRPPYPRGRCRLSALVVRGRRSLAKLVRGDSAWSAAADPAESRRSIPTAIVWGSPCPYVVCVSRV